jgi:hypothetical protein
VAERHLLEGLAADVLHHDVAGLLASRPVGVLHEVVDLHDVGVLDRGQELPLGHSRRHGLGVAAVEQALEHDPAVADVAVAGQVNPAEAAVGHAAEHLVLAGDQVACLQLGREGVPGAAVPAKATRPRELAIPAAADRPVTPAAEPLVLRNLRVG